MRIYEGDVIALIGQMNEYEVMRFDGDYIKLLCIDFKGQESITYDLSVYSHNTEFWVHISDLHLFELIS